MTIEMVLTLSIEKEAPGVYVATVLDSSGGRVTEEVDAYSSIESAIQAEAQAVPDDFAHFMEIRYGGFSTGTHLLEAIPDQAKALADRLVALVAEAYRVSGH
ncbi:hypothetical protein [Variovorax guangxiensis]|uniref:Uncharacterized protein n=1 Tax=Variovorax guangxiensis TaxID=1775474 RepID=A0A840FTF5_9BURK|nr:hypothetical protein [Variovorax guangxiensis]MBB4223435.1 hypothetical protein [Variovorax guangxiensis]